MSVEIFMYMLFGISVITGLVVEAIKMMIKRTDYNIIAGAVAVVLTILTAVAYGIWNNISLDAKYIIFFICLAFMSWLSAMLGFDKVKQALLQIGANNE